MITPRLDLRSPAPAAGRFSGRCRPLRAASLILVVALAGPEACRAAEALAADGRRLSGTATVADARLALTPPKAPGGAPAVVLPIDRVVALRFDRRTCRPPAACVRLADGGVLAGRVSRLADGNLTFASDTFGTVSLPAKDVELICLGGEGVAGPGRLPGVVFANGDEMPAAVTEIAAAQVVLRLGERTVRIPRQRCRWVRLSASAAAGAVRPAPAQARQFVRLANGDLLAGRLDTLDAEQLVLVGPTGRRWRASRPEVVEVRTEGGGIVPLSTLTPTATKHVPQFDEHFAAARDRNLFGRAIRIAGRRYDRGLACHSRCELTYDLAGGFARFLADVGIDDSARPLGSVRFVVETDGRKAFDSGDLRGRDAPHPVNVPVKGVRTLRLIVDFGPGGDSTGDHADWAGAVVTQ